MDKNRPKLNLNIIIPLVTLIIAAAIVAIIAIKEPGNLLNKIFISTTNITGITDTTIDKIKLEPKLVVLESEITVTSKRRSNKEWNIFGHQLNLGETVVEMRVPGNKIQYIIHTDKIDKNRITYNKKDNTLTIYIPKPEVDNEIIEVQSDPTKIEIRTSIGWGRFNSYSGKYLEKEIRKNLRKEVYKKAREKSLQNKANQSAIEIIKKLFEKALPKSQKPTLKIKFQN